MRARARYPSQPAPVPTTRKIATDKIMQRLSESPPVRPLRENPKVRRAAGLEYPIGEQGVSFNLMEQSV